MAAKASTQTASGCRRLDPDSTEAGSGVGSISGGVAGGDEAREPSASCRVAAIARSVVDERVEEVMRVLTSRS